MASSGQVQPAFASIALAWTVGALTGPARTGLAGFAAVWSKPGPIARTVALVLSLGLTTPLAGCGAPDPLAELVPGERGRVVRVIDGDALVLDTGQSVRLVSVEAPALAWRDRAGQPFAAEAKRMLEDLVLGREVQLYYAGLSRDRYDRALAHVVTIDALGPEVWLNRDLVLRGAARVRVYPDTARGAEGLLGAERTARETGAGLWSLPEYQVTWAADMDRDVRGFVLVDGILGEARLPPPEGETDNRRPRACVRSLLGSALRVGVQGSAVGVCEMAAGTRVRVRGYLRNGEIEITHPLNVSLLAGADGVAGQAP
ncbi:MAG: thermonuclease family protein [Pseudomonadota bacterium]